MGNILYVIDFGGHTLYTALLDQVNIIAYCNTVPGILTLDNIAAYSVSYCNQVQ